MKTPCLECSHLAPIKRIPKGDPLEIQLGHQGMLARGLAYCGLKVEGQTYQRFRSLEDSNRCPYFERVEDAARIENRRALASRLRATYDAWIKERRQKRGKL